MTYAKPYTYIAQTPFLSIISGSFVLNGTENPEYVDGKGFTVSRRDVGEFEVTLTDRVSSIISASCNGVGSVTDSPSDFVLATPINFSSTLGPDGYPQLLLRVYDMQSGSFTLTDGPIVGVTFILLVSLVGGNRAINF